MKVGIIADTHIPFQHCMYLRFVTDMFDVWGVNKVVHIGDVVDTHALSFWDHDPDGMSAGDEAQAAAKELEKWKRAFPVAAVCIGNHCARHERVARKAGLPARFLNSYKHIYNTPKWKWDYSHIFDGVLYEHGTGSSGRDAAINLAIQKRMSTVIGHVHTYPGVKYHANPTNTVFGMNVGAGIDSRAYAFSYSRAFPVKPVLGCGIVVDGEHAYFEIMPCGPGEKYHRSRAGRKAA